MRTVAARNNKAGARVATGWLTVVRCAGRKTGTFINCSAMDGGEKRERNARGKRGHRTQLIVRALRLYLRAESMMSESNSSASTVLRDKHLTTR